MVGKNRTNRAFILMVEASINQEKKVKLKLVASAAKVKHMVQMAENNMVQIWLANIYTVLTMCKTFF